MRTSGLTIALLAGAAALTLAAWLAASPGGGDATRRVDTAPPTGDPGQAGAPLPAPQRRATATGPSGEPPLAPIDLAPVLSAPRTTSPRLTVRNAEYRLQVGRGQWIAAEPHPGLRGTGDDLVAQADGRGDFAPHDTAFVPPEAAEVRAAGHAAQPVHWVDDPKARIGRRAVIRPDALLLLRGPGLGAHGEDLRITDTWHDEAGRRTLTPAVLLVEALDDDTIAIAADTERWRPVLGARTGEGRIELTPFTATSVFWRAEPGVHDDVDLGVPAGWVTFGQARVELHEHGPASQQFMGREIRVRLHEDRSVRHDLDGRVRIVTRIGGDVIAETRVHPHPRLDLPAGLGPVTASIVREDGHFGVVCFEPGAERIEVTMAPPARVQGRVVDQRGTPLRGAVVELRVDPPNDQGWTRGCVDRSGADGAFDIAAPGPPPLPVVEPGTSITLPGRGHVEVATHGGDRTRVPVTLVPGRTTICADVVIELETVVTLVASERIQPELGEVLEIAWPGRSTEVMAQRWDSEHELGCDLAPGTSWAETPRTAIVRTTTATFAAARDGDDLVLGPTYRRDLNLEVEAEPDEQLVLLYEWRGSRCVAFEPQPPVPERLTWTGTFPAPRATLVYELRDARTGAVRASGSFGTAGELAESLRIGR